MVLKKFIVLTGISLLSLVAIAQAESIARQSQIKHKYIVTTKDSNQRSTAKLISALAAAGFERVKIKSLFPQFCQLSKRNGKSPEVNHLRMLEAGIESLHELDTSRNAALRSYLKMPSSKNFCQFYVVDIRGKDLKRFPAELRKHTIAAQTVRRYAVRKADAQHLLPFPLAKVKGELLLYSTVDAAQAMLSALHQGAERLILPYAESDQILNILAGRLSAAGCLVSKDLVEPTVSAASGITVTGQVQFDYDPIALGYKTDHFKMLVMNSASSSSGGTQPVPIEIGSGVKSEFRQISPTLYEYKITNMPSTRVMMALAGEYFLCGDGVSFNPVVDYSAASGNVAGRKFNCYWAPGMTSTISFNVGESYSTKKVQGVYITIDNYTPGVTYENSFRYIYTRLNGDAQITFPVGSFIRWAIYDNWQLMGEPEYSLRVSSSAKLYAWTAHSGGVTLGARNLDYSVCFKAAESNGKPLRYQQIKGDFYKGSTGYFDWADTGDDGYNCFSYIPASSTYRLAAQSPYSGIVEGTLGGSSIHRDLIAAPRPTSTSTPKQSPTKTPSRTPTKAPTRTPEKTPTPESTGSKGTPTATKTNGGGTGFTPTATPIPVRTIVATIAPTATPTATASGVTVDVVLTNSTGTSLSGYKVRLLVDGRETDSQLSSKSGAVKFLKVPARDVVVEPQAVEGCKWGYSLTMPFEDVKQGKPVLQSAILECDSRPSPTPTAKNTVVRTATPTPSKTVNRYPTPTKTVVPPTKTPVPLQTATPTHTATNTATPTKTATRAPTIPPTTQNVLGYLVESTSRKPIVGRAVELLCNESSRGSLLSNSSGLVKFTGVPFCTIRFVPAEIPGCSLSKIDYYPAREGEQPIESTNVIWFNCDEGIVPTPGVTATATRTSTPLPTRSPTATPTKSNTPTPIASAQPTSSGGHNETISGRVVDSLGTGVKDVPMLAKIKAPSFYGAPAGTFILYTTTDSNGNYIFKDVPVFNGGGAEDNTGYIYPGLHYDVHAAQRNPAYSPGETFIDLKSAENENIIPTFKFREPIAVMYKGMPSHNEIVYGQVLDKNNVGLPGVTIVGHTKVSTVVDPSGWRTFSTVSGDNGNYGLITEIVDGMTTELTINGGVAVTAPPGACTSRLGNGCHTVNFNAEGTHNWLGVMKKYD